MKKNFRVKRLCIDIISILFVALTASILFTGCVDSNPQTHTHTPGTVVKEKVVEATCTKDGRYEEVVYCTSCGDELSRESHTVEKLGHNLEHHEGKTPTSCSETGWSEYDTCTRCAYSTYKVATIPHTPSEVVEENRVEATCTTEGYYDKVIYCTVCEKELGRSHETIAITHVPAEPVREYEVEPTCFYEGQYVSVVYCSICNKELSSELIYIPLVDCAPGRTEQVDLVEASCTSDGSYWEVTLCRYCEKELSREYKILPQTEHVLGRVEYENESDATCSKEGGMDIVSYCFYCGEEYARTHQTYGKLRHTQGEPVREDGKPATCYEEGYYYMVSYCTVCKEEMLRVPYSTAITHTPGDAVKENTIEPVYGYNATGTDGGYDEVVYCSICQEELRRTHTTTRITAAEYYSKYDYLELSSAVNAPSNLVQNSDGTYTMTATTNNGKSVRLLIVGNVSSLVDGWGTLDEGTKVYTLDALPGMNYIEYEIASQKSSALLFDNYCSLSQKTSVESIDELFESHIIEISTNSNATEFMSYPDYICMNKAGVTMDIVSMKIYYCNTMTEVEDVRRSTYMDGRSKLYVKGDRYDAAIEEVGGDMFAFGLELLLNNPEFLGEKFTSYIGLYTIIEDVKFGNIIDANGTVVDKTNRFLQDGDKIEVTIGNCKKYFDLCYDTFEGSTLYEASTSGYIKSLGTQNVLVVPVTFNDQKNRINDTWMASLRGALGNIIGDDGKVTEYTLSNGNLSLSKYLSTSLYGKFTTYSYITEPYVFDGNAADYYDERPSDTELNAIEKWLNELDLDRSAFDQNNDGYYDIVMLVNTLQISDNPTGIQGYNRTSWAGAFLSIRKTDLSNAGTHEKPNINTFINVAMRSIGSGTDESDTETYTLHHEFGHAFGLQDYYDYDENNILRNTFGFFDMEADNKGDWNSYTKYLLGWIEPTIVDGTEDEVEITISSYATHGDAIVVHALGYDDRGTPFDEYVIIDLFAHDGLYANDARYYALSDSIGVRIYHVNSVYRAYETASDGTTMYAPHHGIVTSARFHDYGIYLLEMIQKGKENTFTGENYADSFVDYNDLFYAGDSFSADEYTEFFYEGKMDNGMDFGYTITVKEIVENGADSTATIVISKKA